MGLSGSSTTSRRYRRGPTACHEVSAILWTLGALAHSGTSNRGVSRRDGDIARPAAGLASALPRIVSARMSRFASTEMVRCGRRTPASPPELHRRWLALLRRVFDGH